MQSTRALTAFFLAFVSVNALTTTWQNSAGGNWSDPSNWDAGVPKTNDSAVIDMLTGSPIHCNVSINLYSLSLNFARLYLFNSSTIETVQQTGGSLYFENNSQVNNLYLSGNLYISPTTTVTISKLFQVTSPSVVSSSYTTGGLLYLGSSCVADVTATSLQVLQVQIRNYGDFTIYSSSISIGNSAQIYNFKKMSAIGTNSTISSNYSIVGVLNNLAQISVSMDTSASFSIAGIIFNNNGTYVVNSGTGVLGSTGQHYGDFQGKIVINSASGTSMDFYSSCFINCNTLNITGQGLYRIYAPLYVTYLYVSGGNIYYINDFPNTVYLYVSGGDLSFSHNVTVYSLVLSNSGKTTFYYPSNLQYVTLQDSATLSVTDTITVNSIFNWICNGYSFVSGSYTSSFILAKNSEAYISGSLWGPYIGSASIYNYGTFNYQYDNPLGFIFVNSSVVNYGTFLIYSTAPWYQALPSAYTNYGNTTIIQNFMLNSKININNYGAFVVETGSQLTLEESAVFNQYGGRLIVNDKSNITGSLYLEAGTVEGTGYIANMTQSGGEIIPGVDATGEMMIGNLVQTNGGTVRIKCQSEADHDVLTIFSGSMEGDLYMQFLDGFTIDDSFNLTMLGVIVAPESVFATLGSVSSNMYTVTDEKNPTQLDVHVCKCSIPTTTTSTTTTSSSTSSSSSSVSTAATSATTATSTSSSTSSTGKATTLSTSTTSSLTTTSTAASSSSGTTISTSTSGEVTSTSSSTTNDTSGSTTTTDGSTTSTTTGSSTSSTQNGGGDVQSSASSLTFSLLTIFLLCYFI